MLISRSNPDIYALRFDSAEAESQGICCGPGYVVQAFNEFGELMVVGPTRGITDNYHMFEPGRNDDVTFTNQQWLRYSRFEARRCRSETN